MYFTERLSHKELPSDYKKKISEESKAAPSKPAVTADKPAPVPAESLGHHRKEADEEIMGAALQTTAAGQDYMRGIQSILNSIEKEPLTLWRKEVSVYKTINSGLGLNITTTFCYTLNIIDLYHR